MASLTKLASLTGNEEFQVSATQKVTAQQIADERAKQILLMQRAVEIEKHHAARIACQRSLLYSSLSKPTD